MRGWKESSLVVTFRRIQSISLTRAHMSQKIVCGTLRCSIHSCSHRAVGDCFQRTRAAPSTYASAPVLRGRQFVKNAKALVCLGLGMLLTACSGSDGGTNEGPESLVASSL